MSNRLYLDSSAYLCVLLGEKGGTEVERAMERSMILSSTLLVLETERNLIRYSREGILSAEQLHQCRTRLSQDVRRMVLRDLTPDLCKDPCMPVVATPRSLDLVHLVTAMWFHAREAIDQFLTRDDTQRVAARELGLPV